MALAPSESRVTQSNSVDLRTKGAAQDPHKTGWAFTPPQYLMVVAIFALIDIKIG